MLIRVSIVFVLLLTLNSQLSTEVYAVNMNSTNYNIIFGNLNIGSGRHDSPNYSMTTSLGQTFADRFTSSGFVVKVGFQYIFTTMPFEFEISSTLINFGTLIPNTFPTPLPTLDVTITNPSRGYDVQVIEDHPLRTLSLHFIPDTTCNGGIQACSRTSANVWTSTAATGFGYNASGHDVTADFLNNTYYRPFASREAGHSPVTFMSSTIAAKNRISTVTFLANIDGAQATGTYQTVINFIAVPKY